MAVTGQTDEMWAGNLHVQRFTLTDDDQPLSPPRDLTSKTLKYALTQIDPDTGEYLGEPTVLEKITGGGIVLVGLATAGIVDVTIDPADTVDFVPGDYHMELEEFDPSNNSVVVAEGTLTIRRNVKNTL